MNIGANLEFALAALQVIGLVAFAASGALAAKRKGMDAVGAISIAFVTAFGGGSLRDMLLGRTPVFWVRQPFYAMLVLITACLAFFFLAEFSEPDSPQPPSPRQRGLAASRRIYIITDAAGLGLFAVTGAAYSVGCGTSYLIAALMAVVTGAFGGVLRDVLLNEIPDVFQQRTELYATCAFLGAWVYLLLHWLTLPDTSALTAGAAVAAILRLLAVAFHWQLPEPRIRGRASKP